MMKATEALAFTLVYPPAAQILPSRGGIKGVDGTVPSSPSFASCGGASDEQGSRPSSFNSRGRGGRVMPLAAGLEGVSPATGEGVPATDVEHPATTPSTARRTSSRRMRTTVEQRSRRRARLEQLAVA